MKSITFFLVSFFFSFSVLADCQNFSGTFEQVNQDYTPEGHGKLIITQDECLGATFEYYRDGLHQKTHSRTFDNVLTSVIKTPEVSRLEKVKIDSNQILFEGFQKLIKRDITQRVQGYFLIKKKDNGEVILQEVQLESSSYRHVIFVTLYQLKR